MRLPFGKFKGEHIEDVDLGYLKWLEEQEWLQPSTRVNLQHEIERREGDVTSLGKVRKGEGDGR
jgi:uncharacterized protein (DUF3820 family)